VNVEIYFFIILENFEDFTTGGKLMRTVKYADDLVLLA
jgi:hypothetical protein